MKITKQQKKALSDIGRVGGKRGFGAAKVRGDSEYYRRLRSLSSGKFKHGGCGTPEYKLWKNIKSRCLNSKTPDYKFYGARGITICDKWKNSFESFLLDVGKRPAEHLTLDRIENNKNYEPGNVMWATRKQQANNRRFTSTQVKCKCLNCKKIFFTYACYVKRGGGKFCTNPCTLKYKELNK